jgi:membrane protein YdbS with pleckstrin-like domain
MAFPPDLLRNDEKLVLDTRPHWWYITPAVTALALTVLLAAIVAAKSPSGSLGQVATWLTIGLLVASLIYLISRYLKWISTNFVVTSDRVIYRVGVFAKSGVEIPVDKINIVLFEQRIPERMLGLGNIKIESASETGSSVFSTIPHPSAVQNIIYGVVDAKSHTDANRVGQSVAQAMKGQSAAGGAGAGAQASIPEQIEQLQSLRDKGAITEEEFQAKKADLLDRM